MSYSSEISDLKIIKLIKTRMIEKPSVTKDIGCGIKIFPPVSNSNNCVFLSLYVEI